MDRTTLIIDLLTSLHGVDRVRRSPADERPAAIDLMTAVVIGPHPDHPDGETLMLEYPWGLRTGGGRPELRDRAQPVVSIERPLELILLMDPERGFTVTSAVLPRASFRPPGACERVRARSLMFFTGPVLGARDELRMRRPGERIVR